MRQLARRDYGLEELRQWLMLRGFPAKEVHEVTEWFRGEGYQSDRRFAESLTSSRIRQGYGERRIRAELRHKGVADAPLESLSGVDWTLLLEKTYLKKYGTSPPVNEKERAARGRYLLRRGFEGAAIRRLFRQLSQLGAANEFFNEMEDV